MTEDLRNYLSEHLGERIIACDALSGGDISEVYRVRTRKQPFLMKFQDGSRAIEMLESERNGLEAIARTGTIRTPKVLQSTTFSGRAFLLMEYVETKQPELRDLERLGRQLASMHQVAHTHFGWERDNFIGSLDQLNTFGNDWSQYYASNRLDVQLKLARDHGLLSGTETPSETTMLGVLEQLCPDVTPSLIHGDLWGGNYLISSAGDPYLIDPAISYGHAEMDLAMSRLFGGFGSAFYAAYHEVIPLTSGSGERNDIYQLYYLLVHLNLFGAAYYRRVKHILDRYLLPEN